MKEYLKEVIIPYVERKRKDLQLTSNHPALALLDEGASQISPVDLRMSIMKPLGARWLVSLYDYIKEHNSLILNGFKAAGIL